MNGIILINKPTGYTSRDIVNIISKKLQTKKVGHTGTLDPLATGVLVICVGNCTKLVELLTSTHKEYEAEIVLGIKTDTGDITGNILETKESLIKKDQIENVLSKIKGRYLQQVPIYSAVKINGKKLYEYARSNKPVTLPKREVEISKIELINEPIIRDNKTIFKIKCTVSKGTYIRSLVEDIAALLNTIGTMSSLNRTKQGNFKLEDCNNIDDEYDILTPEQALTDIKLVEVDNELEFKITNGVPIENTYNQDLIMFKGKNTLCIYKNCNNTLKMYKKIY